MVVTLTGMAWIQAWSWHGGALKARGGAGTLTVAYPVGAVLTLLAVFHVVLRPGIPFY
jgi:hypothetical protein